MSRDRSWVPCHVCKRWGTAQVEHETERFRCSACRTVGRYPLALIRELDPTVCYARRDGRHRLVEPRFSRDATVVTLSCSACGIDSECPAGSFNPLSLLPGDSFREKYQAYLQTAAWKRIRRLVLERDQHRCTACGSAEALHVHHRTYVRIGREELGDLLTLCEGCHFSFHAERDAREVADVR